MDAVSWWTPGRTVSRALRGRRKGFYGASLLLQGLFVARSGTYSGTFRQAPSPEVPVSRPAGNTRLKAARVAAGYNSQQALADAITRTAPRIGVRGLTVGVRQVRRWESRTPPWPHPDIRRVLTHLLGQSMEELGFTPPWGAEGAPAAPAGHRWDQSWHQARHRSGAGPPRVATRQHWQGL